MRLNSTDLARTTMALLISSKIRNVLGRGAGTVQAPKTVHTTGRTLDFRKETLTWGHNIETPKSNGIVDVIDFIVWSTPYPRVGDEIVWSTAYGEAHGTIMEVNPYTDPVDMFKIKVFTQGRKVKKSLKEQVERDKPFEVEGYIDG